MIAEVDNTFGERRCYMLYEGQTQPEDGPHWSPAVEKISLGRRVQYSWKKDFHVSPFNSRKGGYSLRANDPLDGQSDLPGAVDITATVKDSKGAARLVARLHSVAPPIDSAKLTVWRQCLIVLSWWWVGLITCELLIA